MGLASPDIILVVLEGSKGPNRNQEKLSRNGVDKSPENITQVKSLKAAVMYSTYVQESNVE